MATISLPTNPSLDHLRHQARTLQQAVRSRDTSAVARVARQHPDGVPADPADFSLSIAQLVVAREYGFTSWPRLKHYFDIITRHGWDTTPPPDGRSEVADEFCRLACLTYGDDENPARRAEARELLGVHPDLPASHIWAAATAGKLSDVRRLLAEDPGLATLRGGPYGWTPLCYLAYSRLDPDVRLDDVLGIARLLLDAGADPNEGYLWNGRPYAYTLLTGVFGEGERGPVEQPRHPHSLALARLLLDAGADPNDGQALYDRHFGADNDHLELLLAYGLGSGDGGPWKARLPEIVESPAALLRGQLRSAAERDYLDRVRLLVDHGVDVRVAYNGRTPAEVAHLNGHARVVDFLVSRGAPPPALDPAGEFVAAAFRGDRGLLDRLVADHPGIIGQVQRAHPGLIVHAAGGGRPSVVALLAELGFDVNARASWNPPDAPERTTALHHIAFTGNIEVARLLLSYGAEPNLRDPQFNATPLGWARYSGQEPMVEVLAPLTTAEEL